VGRNVDPPIDLRRPYRLAVEGGGLFTAWMIEWMNDGKMDFNSESVGILTNLSGSMTLCHQKL